MLLQAFPKVTTLTLGLKSGVSLAPIGALGPQLVELRLENICGGEQLMTLVDAASESGELLVLKQLRIKRGSQANAGWRIPLGRVASTLQRAAPSLSPMISSWVAAGRTISWNQLRSGMSEAANHQA